MSKNEKEALALPTTKTTNSDEATQMTCAALCSLSTAATATATTTAPSPHNLCTLSSACASTISHHSIDGFDIASLEEKPSRSSRCGSSSNKQLQLPMFLSKTYHMIEKCDPEIATWSANGDNFVVKNVEKFATAVLPLYFKHSNFSSFARQLNFYGFRKLRTDPILTNDVDPRTACYVRFFHEKFQKDKPELLHLIKRATKTDQQSKDDLDILKQEVDRLKEINAQMKEDFDRRLAELSYECNRRVTALSADYDKLVALVQPLLQQSLCRQEQAISSTIRDFGSTNPTQMPDLLQSLSAAALSQLRAAQPGAAPLAAQQALMNEATNANKRSREESMAGVPVSARPRFDS